MAIPSLKELFAAMRSDPGSLLTSRRLRSLVMFLSGRDLALAHLGAGGWGDIPIAERVEKHYGVSTKAWRNWSDIVEYFADDEFDALLRFLDLANQWDDPPPAPSPSLATSPPLPDLLAQIAARPAMFLGEKSIFLLADFLRGYTETVAAATEQTDALVPFLAGLPSSMGDESGRPWFKLLRFHSATDEEAFDKFFELWSTRS